MTADEALRWTLAVLLPAATGYSVGQNFRGAGPAVHFYVRRPGFMFAAQAA